jgi:hypothetical protein
MSKPITFTNLGGMVYVVEDGIGGCIGISRAQIEELFLADDEPRTTLLAQWRREAEEAKD